MTAIPLGIGVILILAALWNRDEERLAIILFIVGGALVLVGGALFLPQFFMPPD